MENAFQKVFVCPIMPANPSIIHHRHPIPCIPSDPVLSVTDLSSVLVQCIINCHLALAQFKALVLPIEWRSHRSCIHYQLVLVQFAIHCRLVPDPFMALVLVMKLRIRHQSHQSHSVQAQSVINCLLVPVQYIKMVAVKNN